VKNVMMMMIMMSKWLWCSYKNSEDAKAIDMASILKLMVHRNHEGGIHGVRRPAILTEVFRGITQFLQANSGKET
jgi:hypothetical protein